YQKQRDELKRQALAGLIPGTRHEARDRAAWPPAVRDFADSQAAEDFTTAGQGGDRMEYLVRRDDDVWSYPTDLPVAMDALQNESRGAREAVRRVREQDLRRGVKLTYILMAASVWLMALAALIYVAHRISRPIHQLTAGLGQLAAGDLTVRVEPQRDD